MEHVLEFTSRKLFRTNFCGGWGTKGIAFLYSIYCILILSYVKLLFYGFIDKISNSCDDIDLVRGIHPVERPARADRDTDRAERGRCFDTYVQVFPLDEYRGQDRYPTYTPNSNINSSCIRKESQIRCNIFTRQSLFKIY